MAQVMSWPAVSASARPSQCRSQGKCYSSTKKKTGNVCNSNSPGGRFQTDQVGYKTQNSQKLGKGTQEFIIFAAFNEGMGHSWAENDLLLR